MPTVRSAPMRAALLLVAALQLLSAAAVPLLHRHLVRVGNDVVSEVPTRPAADIHPCVVCRNFGSMHPTALAAVIAALAPVATPSFAAAGEPIASETRSSARARAPPRA